jgi:hypothetical protein
MQQTEQLHKSPFPMMITVAGGRSIGMDHVLQIETQALESHKTILVHTTCGAYMFHDEVALDFARAFNLRPPAQEVARSQEPGASGGKRRKS